MNAEKIITGNGIQVIVFLTAFSMMLLEIVSNPMTEAGIAELSELIFIVRVMIVITLFILTFLFLLYFDDLSLFRREYHSDEEACQIKKNIETNLGWLVLTVNITVWGTTKASFLSQLIYLSGIIFVCYLVYSARLLLEEEIKNKIPNY